MNKHNNIKVIWLGQAQFESLLYKRTLKALGYQTCDIMDSYNNDEIEIWRDILLRKQSIDYNLFNGYDALVHPPQTSFYQELVQKYPDAKFILEDMNGKVWQKRYARLATLMKVLFWLRLFKKSRNLLSLIDLTLHFYSGGKTDKITLQNKWDEFTIDVQKNIPPHRLLLFNKDSEWKPLCDFLGKPIPNVPLPLNNDKKTINQTIKHVSLSSSKKNHVFIVLYFIVLISLFIYLMFFY